MSTCTICLDELKNPVSTPCGHLHCETCIAQVIESSEDAVTASCPTCRAPFCIAQPDLRFIPTKYHKFLMPSVRRVYFEAGPQVSSSSSTSSSTESDADLKDQISALEARVASLTRDKSLLMDRCEMTISASTHHAQKERIARLNNQNLKKEVETLKTQLKALKFDYDGYRIKCDSLEDKLRLMKNRMDAPSPVKSSSKRTSTQAALDGTFLSSRLPEQDGEASTRLVLPIPKRPRLCDRARRTSLDASSSSTASSSHLVPPPIFKKRSSRISDDMGLGNIPSRSSMTPVRTSIFMTANSAASSATLTSGSLPARSGLSGGDLFSPTHAAKGDEDEVGHGSIDFESGVFPSSSPEQSNRLETYICRGSKLVRAGLNRFVKMEDAQV
ncbi:hypothetical protein EIP91_007414 [Steccherinum ochraceum]|uniref:RING-type domain-containing protein n=1 Tax=Steccherinum ochraceum TaxID=92696 RepID=A0A4R0S0S1_9APHY|nr:hypothetical protein EIP91_007414 [Steccherinum ochraceum]